MHSIESIADGYVPSNVRIECFAGQAAQIGLKPAAAGRESLQALGGGIAAASTPVPFMCAWWNRRMRTIAEAHLLALLQQVHRRPHRR